MTEVAVVILNYNGRNFLKQFLPSVIQYSGHAKIIVADNASTDDSIQLIESEFAAQVEVLKMHRNRGYCGGYNFALNKIDAEYFVLLNSDVEVTPDWIEPVITLLKSDSSIAAAQPKILSFHKKNKFEYAGAAGGFIDMLGYPFCRGRLFTDLEEDRGQYNDICPVFWATGACLFIKSELFKKLGGLDEDFFAHMEEIDLCWRLNRAGYQVYYHGGSTVFHVGGGTLSASNPRKTYLNFRNGLSLLIKHLSFPELIWKLPIRLGLDWFAAALFLVNNKPADAKAVLMAHFDFFKNLKGDLAKRKKILEELGAFRVQHIYRNLLPLQYFLLKKKTFNDLREI
jgi:GT2 family glycosyltransferase